MADDATFERGNDLINRIAEAALVLGLDTQKACERMLCEEISRGFDRCEIVKHMIKGGCIHPQPFRQTSNLHMLFGRRMTVEEIHRAFAKMTPGLEAKGITVESYSKTPDTLMLDGHMGERYHVVAKAGRTRIRIEVNVSGGTHLFPRFYNGPRHGSIFYRGQEPLLAHYQPVESHAADKLMSMLSHGDTMRWKDFRDLAILSDMQMDPRLISADVIHGLRGKAPTDTELLALMPQVPAALEYDLAASQGIGWQLWAAQNGVQGDWEETLSKARHLYASVRERVIAAFDTGPRMPRSPRVRMTAKMRERVTARVERDDNVVDMSAWWQAQPGYRPRGL